MKPGMLFSIVLLTAIILAASFGLHIAPMDPIWKIPSDMVGRVLYVCPAADSVFDATARGLVPAMNYLLMAFFAAVMILTFIGGWKLYQNLLEDKFKQKDFESVWMFAKALFWIAIVLIVLISTPNYYRTVRVGNSVEKYVLCEENTPGAVPVLSNKVKRK